MERVRVTEIDDPHALGGRLRAARQQRGLSLRQLAFPGCTAAYISTIENGRRVPSLQVLTVLADRLGLSASFLATGREDRGSRPIEDAELALRLGDVDRARQEFEALLADSVGDIRRRCLGGLGICSLHRGELEAGIELLEQARGVDEEAFLIDISLVEALGRAYANRSTYEASIALFSQARARALEHGDQLVALRLAVLLANTYIDVGDTVHSNDTLADALASVGNLRDPRPRANVLWTQARLHTVEGRHDLAAEFAQRALETLRVTEDDRAVAFAEQTLAYIELERGNPERALELLNSAAPTIDRVAESFEQAVFELERARVLLALGRPEEARELLGEFGPVLHAGPRVDGARYYVVLAEIYEQLGDSDDAVAMYDAAIERLSDHRSPHLVRAYRLKSVLLEKLGRPDEALAALRAGLSIQDASSSWSEARRPSV